MKKISGKSWQHASHAMQSLGSTQNFSACLTVCWTALSGMVIRGLRRRGGACEGHPSPPAPEATHSRSTTSTGKGASEDGGPALERRGRSERASVARYAARPRVPPRHGTMPAPSLVFEKRDRWRDARVAREYDARRFSGVLGRRKHRRDAACVLALLARAGEVRRVLDLPCGTGRMFAPLAGAGFRVAGADVSREMLGASRARSEARPANLVGSVQSDVLRLPFAPGAFDAVVCLRFLRHVKDPEVRVAMLGEMARVARRGVVGEARYRWSLKHLGRFLRSRVGLTRKYRPSQGRAGLRAELARAGLELVELRPASHLFSDKAFFLARVV